MACLFRRRARGCAGDTACVATRRQRANTRKRTPHALSTSSPPRGRRQRQRQRRRPRRRRPRRRPIRRPPRWRRPRSLRRPSRRPLRRPPPRRPIRRPPPRRSLRRPPPRRSLRRPPRGRSRRTRLRALVRWRIKVPSRQLRGLQALRPRPGTHRQSGALTIPRPNPSRHARDDPRLARARRDRASTSPRKYRATIQRLNSVFFLAS